MSAGRVGRVALALTLTLGAAACASAPPRAEPSLAARLARPDARRAAQLAPDLYARAVRADAQALAARDGGERADHAERARLLLAAALAEAERIDDERAKGGADDRAERAAAERAALERERQQIEQRIAEQTAAGAARAQAALAMGADAAKAAPSERARFLRERARLVLAAARVLGLPEAQARKVEPRIAQAEQARSGAAAVAAAQSALVHAERALGQARVARTPDRELASAEECAALAEMARERGFAPEPGTGGLALPLAAAFAAAPSARHPSLLQGLAQLASAHPRGAIQIAAERTQAERIAASLRETRDAAGLQRTQGGSDGPKVVFTACRAQPQ